LGRLFFPTLFGVFPTNASLFAILPWKNKLAAETLTGLNLGWGYRFPLTSGLGGRFEANYTLMGENTNAGFPPINTFALQFGVTLPMR
jgi:hypothetical protein